MLSMANQPANHDRTKKHVQHNGVLFFGGHTRIKPKQQNQQRTDIPVAWQSDIEKKKQKQKKIPDAGKNDSFESKKEDPFTKKVVENAESHRSGCFGRILQSWADEESVLRLSWMTVVAIILSLLGATVFYFIERNTVCKWDFAKSLWFVNTISTTIGSNQVQ